MARAIVKSHSSSSIGSIKQSMLDEATFQSIHGTGWVLMDGRNLSITNPGSAYEALTGQSILPNAKGRFLRGLDTSGTVDPDGAGRVLGSSQNDAFGSHNHGGGNHAHSYQQGAGVNAGSSGTQTDATAKNRAFPTRTTGSSGNIISTQGGAETRPKNIAVNIFIKINE